jgi:hypothetical protein
VSKYDCSIEDSFLTTLIAVEMCTYYNSGIRKCGLFFEEMTIPVDYHAAMKQMMMNLKLDFRKLFK